MLATGQPSHPTPNSYWVRPGRLLAGDYPGASTPDEAVVKLRALLEGGVDHFIDLTEHREPTRTGAMEPYDETAGAVARELGKRVEWERHAIRDLGVPRTPAEMAGILDAVDAALDGGKTVYLHCWGGTGRTGTVVGCWLVRHGLDGGAALRRIAELRQGIEKLWRAPKSPETPEQRDYVRGWAEPGG